MTDFNFDNIAEFDKDQLAAESRIHIKNLCEVVLGKLPSELSKEEIVDIVCLDLSSFPVELTVSAGATRRTEVQYCSNNYHLSEKLDVSMQVTYIKDSLSRCETGQAVIDRYISLRGMMFELIKTKVMNTEQFLRDMIAEAERKDGQAPQGRYS